MAIKKIFFDRNYVQREVPILVEIYTRRKTENIIRLVDRYLKVTEDKKSWPKMQKEYLYIVTDYMPYTICDLNISPNYYMSQDKATPNEMKLSQAKNHCLESIK